MDAEECDEFTDVYFVKFHLVTNARYFAALLWFSFVLKNALLCP